MKLSKKIKIALISIFILIFSLFAILIIHIATANPVEIDNATLQISRIDFNEPIDSAKAKEIHRNLKSIPGVKTDRLNIETGVLVFFHDNKISNSEEIYNQLIQLGNYDAKRFTISPELASKKVCPVMNENSFSYKFSRGIQRIFK